MNENKAELLRERTDRGYSVLESCTLCPRDCRVNRLKGEHGVCRLGSELVVSSACLHHGEEPPLSGTRGSGTIFFGSCNLRCVFCQNHPISHMGEGTIVTPRALSKEMLSLQRRGAHNINLVTPTHLVPQIMDALLSAFENGLDVPIVYNTGGYDSLDTLELLDGIVDIYMPDMKYSDSKAAKRLSGVSDYPQRNREAVREMHRQVGDFTMDDEGTGVRGLLVRHLILPNGLAGTKDVMRFIADEISQRTYISLMSQYFPDHLASEFPEISRRITANEYADARAEMEECGLHRGWHQNLGIDGRAFNIRRFLEEGR